MKQKWNIPAIDLTPNTTCTRDDLLSDWERSIRCGDTKIYNNGIEKKYNKNTVNPTLIIHHLLNNIGILSVEYYRATKYLSITAHQAGFNKPIYAYLTLALSSFGFDEKQMRVIDQETTHQICFVPTKSGFTIHETLDGFIDTDALDRVNEMANKARFSCRADIDVNLMGEEPKITLLSGMFDCKNRAVMERLGIDIIGFFQRIINWIKEKILKMELPTITPPTLEARGIGFFSKQDPWTLERDLDKSISSETTSSGVSQTDMSPETFSKISEINNGQ